MTSFAIFEVLTFFGQSLSADQLLQLRELAPVWARKDKPAPGGAGQGGPSAGLRGIWGFQRHAALADLKRGLYDLGEAPVLAGRAVHGLDPPG